MGSVGGLALTGGSVGAKREGGFKLGLGFAMGLVGLGGGGSGDKARNGGTANGRVRVSKSVGDLAGRGAGGGGGVTLASGAPGTDAGATTGTTIVSVTGSRAAPFVWTTDPASNSTTPSDPSNPTSSTNSTSSTPPNLSSRPTRTASLLELTRSVLRSLSPGEKELLMSVASLGGGREEELVEGVARMAAEEGEGNDEDEGFEDEESQEESDGSARGGDEGGNEQELNGGYVLGQDDGVEIVDEGGSGMISEEGDLLADGRTVRFAMADQDETNEVVPTPGKDMESVIAGKCIRC
ncbi:hypothetical protein HDU93_000986 [Gonapodya sp. JEL0774]|nr:hypothetical protein HDU93_000986 [Gonapodya sp. JEL0774]